MAVDVEAVLVWADADATDRPVEPTFATGFASTPPEPTIWAAATTAPAAPIAAACLARAIKEPLTELLVTQA